MGKEICKQAYLYGVYEKVSYMEDKGKVCRLQDIISKVKQDT